MRLTSLIHVAHHSSGSSQKDDWCDGYCLTCAIFPVESLSEYHTKISTNISVRMDQYAGANKLDL